MITRIIHMNIVVTDLDKSLRFYRDMLGGKVSGSSKNENRGAGIALGLGETAEWTCHFIRFGEDPASTVINLLQWIKPASTGKPYSRLNNVGIARIALAVDDVDATYNDLKAKGVEFISPPQEVDLNMSARAPIRIAVCKDPDGTTIEFVQSLATR